MSFIEFSIIYILRYDGLKRIFGPQYAFEKFRYLIKNCGPGVFPMCFMYCSKRGQKETKPTLQRALGMLCVSSFGKLSSTSPVSLKKAHSTLSLNCTPRSTRRKTTKVPTDSQFCWLSFGILHNVIGPRNPEILGISWESVTQKYVKNHEKWAS